MESVPAAQQVKPDRTTPSPLDVADAAIQVVARVTKLTLSCTEEQRKAIRAIPMNGYGGSLGPPKAYHIPSITITDPIAAADFRERRRKMFARTKAAFPDLKVPMPFVSVRAKKETGFSMPYADPAEATFTSFTSFTAST